MSKPYQGLFITLEGGEGAGKSTLAQALSRYLSEKGYTLHTTREPGGTPFSERMRTFILERNEKMKIGNRAELLLFLAARAQHVDEVILPKLHAGEIVICDRFSDSTIAYQGYARHLSVEEVERLCAWSSHNLEPQCTLFLDVDPKIGFERLSKGRKSGRDRLENETLQFHKEVRQGFLHIADKHPERITILDAALPFEQVIKEAIKALQPHLKR